MHFRKLTKTFAIMLSLTLAFNMTQPQMNMGTVRAAGTITSNGEFTVDGTYSNWGESFGYNVQVNNKMLQNVESWKLVIENPNFTIQSIWCATASVSGNTLIITPEDWNKTIAAGNAATFGFGATGAMPTMDRYQIIYYVGGKEYIFVNGANTPVVTATPTVTPTATATPKPTATPTPTATSKPTATPSVAPTTTPASTGDLFVSPNGNGNGTLNSPMSFTKALTEVKPGKTIYCLAGTYSYNSQITVAYGNNGAAGQYKTVAAYNGANVVFD